MLQKTAPVVKSDQHHSYTMIQQCVIFHGCMFRLCREMSGQPIIHLHISQSVSLSGLQQRMKKN